MNFPCPSFLSHHLTTYWPCVTKSLYLAWKNKSGESLSFSPAESDLTWSVLCSVFAWYEFRGRRIRWRMGSRGIKSNKTKHKRKPSPWLKATWSTRKHVGSPWSPETRMMHKGLSMCVWEHQNLFCLYSVAFWGVTDFLLFNKLFLSLSLLFYYFPRVHGIILILRWKNLEISVAPPDSDPCW